MNVPMTRNSASGCAGIALLAASALGAPLVAAQSYPNKPVKLEVGPSVNAKDVRELVAQMKAKPDTFNYASSGAGSTQHLAGEAFKKLAGVQMTHIPYKGSSQAHADLLGGQAQIMFDTTSSAIG